MTRSPHRPSATATLLLLAMAMSLRVAPAATADTAAQSGKPNVLLISIDDLNDWVGCLGGHPQTITPNIDQLAKQGVLFKRAYCNAPSCNPSRTATLTGLAPWVSGVYRNGQKWREVLPDAVTLPQYFKQQGYHCAGAGKIFHHYQNDARSWHSYFPSIKNAFPRDPRAPKANQPKFETWDSYYREFTWGPQAKDIDITKTGDYQSVQHVIGKLESLPADKPFFLNCGIYRPHVPWFVPQPFFDRFPLKDVKLPATPKGGWDADLADLPPFQKRLANRSRYFAALDKEKLHRQAVQAYLASTNYMDTLVGMLLSALDKSPHASNTIVLFWSDHGFHMTEKRWYRKYTLWDDAVHVPVIVRLPKSPRFDGYKRGVASERVVSLLDLYPTLVDLAGLPKKDGLSGRSLTPLLRDPAMAWPHPSIAVGDWLKRWSVRKDRWCYIRSGDGEMRGEELYDQQADPHQWTNLAGKPEHRGVLRELRSALPKRVAADGKPLNAVTTD